MANFKYNYIGQAFSVIKSKIVKTPLVTNDYINKLTENNVYFKLENLQITGSFKYRGALHKILKLSESSKISTYSNKREYHIWKQCNGNSY